MCGQEQVSCEDDWVALSTAGFQPDPAVLHNWFDRNLPLLERAVQVVLLKLRACYRGCLISMLSWSLTEAAW